MSVEYITMIKDYKRNKTKRLKNVIDVLEDRLTCAVCIEKVSSNLRKYRKYEPFVNQLEWSLR